MALIGYARVSTADQSLDLQIDALEKAGCERIFSDRVSGAKDERPGLDIALRVLQEDDTLVVWRLDRLGRSMTHLTETITSLRKRRVHFKSLSESLDTATAAGRMIFHIFASMAEFERELIRERTQAGLQAARDRGRFGGHPRGKLADPAVLARARALYDGREHTVSRICEMLNVSKPTFYRYLRASKAKEQP